MPTSRATWRRLARRAAIAAAVAVIAVEAVLLALFSPWRHTR